MANVLFTRANHDLPTKYMSAYTALLVEFAKQHGHQVTDLYNDIVGAAARLEDFEVAMDQNPNIVIICGHGNATTQTGQDSEVLLKAGVNDDLMSGKKIFLESCSTGISLGPSMVSKTALEVYCYQRDFIFVYNPNFESKPLEDPWAKAFFDSAIATGYAVLLDKTPKEVYELTIERYNYWYDFWLQQNDPMADDILTWLNWNRAAFIAITPDGIYAKEKVSAPSLNLLLPLGVASLFLLLSNYL